MPVIIGEAFYERWLGPEPEADDLLKPFPAELMTKAREHPMSDIEDIKALVSRQFASMSWDEGGAPDIVAFKADFRSDAVLYPSARPLHPLALDAFADRMSGLSRTALRSFQERVIEHSIKVFGNIAVAVFACENTENGTEVNRNVEMMLLVKDQGRWMIAAQAWDKERPEQAIPQSLLAD